MKVHYYTFLVEGDVLIDGSALNEVVSCLINELVSFQFNRFLKDNKVIDGVDSKL